MGGSGGSSVAGNQSRKRKNKTKHSQTKNSQSANSQSTNSQGENGQREISNRRSDAFRKKRKIKPSEVQKELRRIEREIEKMESALEAVEVLRGEHATDYEKLMELDEQETVLKSQLEALLEEWEDAH
jgi:hypothetical protein